MSTHNWVEDDDGNVQLPTLVGWRTALFPTGIALRLVVAAMEDIQEGRMLTGFQLRLSIEDARSFAVKLMMLSDCLESGATITKQ